MLHLLAQGGSKAARETAGFGNFALYIVLGVVLIVMLIVIAILATNIGLYVQAQLSGAKVGLLHIIAMRLRKVNPRVIVLARIYTLQAGLDISTKRLEVHYLSHGDVSYVAEAMVAAHKAGVELDWDTACAFDLAGRDLMDAIHRRDFTLQNSRLRQP